QVRGTHHRQGRSQQHVFHGGTSLQLGVSFSNDMLRRRFFNKLHQRVKMGRISNGSGHDVILLEAGKQPSICVRGVCGRERNKIKLAENALVSNIKQPPTRQAKYAPTPLAHMVENVLGYLSMYEAGVF